MCQALIYGHSTHYFNQSSQKICEVASNIIPSLYRGRDEGLKQLETFPQVTASMRWIWDTHRARVTVVDVSVTLAYLLPC